MPQAFTSYLVDNDRKFKDAINNAKLVVDDLTVPFTGILKDFYRSEKAIFQLAGPGQYPPFKNSGGHFETRKNGTKKWVAAEGGESPYQIKKKKKWGFDYPLLVASGDLSKSLLSPTATGSVAQINPLTLIFGTSIPYGIYHQSDAPRTTMPLRKFLFIGPEAPAFATSDQMGRLNRWLLIIKDYVVKKSKQGMPSGG